MEAAPGSTGMLDRGPDHSLGTSKEGYVKPTRTCTFPGCERAFSAKDLCDGHYQQMRKGLELRPLRLNLRGLTVEQRFSAQIRKSSGCWHWTGTISGNGYGQMGCDGQRWYAHRLSWELFNGPIPSEMVIDHRCHNPRCVNPEHLRVVTKAQNAQNLIGPHRDTTSGVRNVSWDKRRGAWKTQVKLNDKNYSGGYHSTIEAAEAAAKALRAELHTHDDYEDWVAKHPRMEVSNHE